MQKFEFNCTSLLDFSSYWPKQVIFFLYLLQKKVIKYIWKSTTANYFNKLDVHSIWRISTKSMINKSYHNTLIRTLIIPRIFSRCIFSKPFCERLMKSNTSKSASIFAIITSVFIKMMAHAFFSFRKFWLGLPKHAWCQSELILRRARCRIPGRPVRYTESNITAASNGGSDGEQREGERGVCRYSPSGRWERRGKW